MLSRANQSAVDGDVLEFIRSRLPGFSPAERRVADAVLAAPRSVLQMSAARLAETSGSSVGSVVRFCHTLGLPGYQDFKLRVAQQSIPVPGPMSEAISLNDSSPHVVQKLFTNLTGALFDTARTVDAAVLRSAWSPPAPPRSPGSTTAGGSPPAWPRTSRSSTTVRTGRT